MRPLLISLIAFLSSSSYAQSVEELNATIDSLKVVVSVAQEEIGSLTVIRDSMIAEAKLEAIRTGNVPLLRLTTKATNRLFPKSSGGGGELLGVTNGVIAEVVGSRARYYADDGRDGWITIFNLQPSEDPNPWFEQFKAAGLLDDKNRAGLNMMVNGWNNAAARADEQQRRAAAAADRIARDSALEEALRKSNVPIRVLGVIMSKNSAGGLEPYLRIKNISNREIKYVTLEFRVFNPVGDPAPDSYGDRTNLMRLQLVGPIGAGQEGSYNYENDPPFYNNVASCMELRRAKTDFMDGGTFTMVNDIITARGAESNYRISGECQ